MLGLALELRPDVRTSFLCFRDRGSSLPFLERLHQADIPARMLDHANPRFMGMVRDIRRALRTDPADLLVCHGYKADVLGWMAARSLSMPVISVSRGWTAHTWKVRLNESLDRRMLRRMDRVVCVSGGQAAKVRGAGVDPARIRVIHNAINLNRFSGDRSGREVLGALFPNPPECVAIAVGRLSPEKAFEHFIEAAAVVTRDRSSVGFVLVGDGPERSRLDELVRERQLQNRFAMTGFRTDVDSLISGADILVQSSRTEGLPNVVLEACAASIPVVATDVGGTAEVVRDGVSGFLVPAGRPELLAQRILSLVDAPALRASFGARGRELVTREFSFAQQATRYRELFGELLSSTNARTGQNLRA
jgi:glycosyltransferase involved in cell wall biosynthesis